ncbi:hypothetical protein HK096_007776 [Nowakowskiella sp. JEL0078]|nr:hypothetical protein HK096_007776 [Nowakowskiella sp. JEL0078]
MVLSEQSIAAILITAFAANVISLVFSLWSVYLSARRIPSFSSRRLTRVLFYILSFTSTIWLFLNWSRNLDPDDNIAFAFNLFKRGCKIKVVFSLLTDFIISIRIVNVFIRNKDVLDNLNTSGTQSGSFGERLRRDFKEFGIRSRVLLMLLSILFFDFLCLAVEFSSFFMAELVDVQWPLQNIIATTFSMHIMIGLALFRQLKTSAERSANVGISVELTGRNEFSHTASNRSYLSTTSDRKSTANSSKINIDKIGKTTDLAWDASTYASISEIQPNQEMTPASLFLRPGDLVLKPNDLKPSVSSWEGPWGFDPQSARVIENSKKKYRVER